MYRVLPAPFSLPLFGIARTRAVEQQAAASLAPHVLMSRAGQAVARLALAVAPHALKIWIAAGPGNNGGDGLEAAIHLHAAGKAVQVSLLGDPNHLPADAAEALKRARAAGLQINAGAAPPDDEIDLAIDALLGIGANRAPADALLQAVAELNALPCPVIAIDVPSGLNVDTGQPLGALAVHATHTLTVLVAKPGLFTAAGRDHAGTVWFDALDVRTELRPDAWLAGAEIGVETPRAHAQHKGSFGDVAIVGGAPGMGGAALLAARAAHAAGAGRIYVDMLDDNAPTLDPSRPELMFRRDWCKSSEPVLASSTVICGCGGGDAVRRILPRVLSAAGRLVLDADALNTIAVDAALQAMLTARASRSHPTVLTPHPLEAARLLDCDAAQVQADRLAAARMLAERFACVVVLKGSGSIIAAPGEVPCINSTGSAALATAGTGDVLAGWLGGLWAQQPGAATSVAMQAACTAVFLHGAAADASHAQVLRAADLIERMGSNRDQRITAVSVPPAQSPFAKRP